MALVEKKRENGTLRVQSVPEGKSRTEQSHQKAVNINTIVAKARKGIPPRVNNGTGVYGDFSSGIDFHEMQNRITDAMLDFMSLPATTRAKFDNDPGKLLDFIANPANAEEARELRLLPEDGGRPLEGDAKSKQNTGETEEAESNPEGSP
jgi:phage internal scaffolding protein